MTKVLIVDDAVLFQAGLAAALKDQGFEVVGTASDAMSGVTEARRLKPDLVILDVLMPGMSGLEVVDKIRDVSPGSKVVLLTASESEEDLLASIKAGASGYIVKDTALSSLTASIREVAAGGAVVSPAMGAKLFEIVAGFLRHRDLTGTRRPALTGREIEILQSIAHGLTSKEIGDLLYISENTVKNHVRNILDKLGLKSRHEAVRYAEEEGLVSRR
jgi:two-component system NarL family response regulator